MPQAKMPSLPPKVQPSPPLPPPPRNIARAAEPLARPPGIGDNDDDAPMSHETLARLGERVVAMLQQATRSSEQQVSSELRKLDTELTALTAKFGRVEALLSQKGFPPANQRAMPCMEDRITLLLHEVELKLDADVREIQRELHQTILAHNHNADLMADHKAAIDRIRSDMETHNLPALVAAQRTEELLVPLQQLTVTIEESQASDQELDLLLRKGEALLARLGPISRATPMPRNGLAPHFAGHSPPLAPMPPPHLPGAMPPGVHPLPRTGPQVFRHPGHGYPQWAPGMPPL